MNIVCLASTVSVFMSLSVVAFGASTPLPYLDESLPSEVRAIDVVKRMTLDEKASQMTNLSRAVPRLGIPAYDWWSESLHGISAEGNTEFPEPIGLAATFDPSVIGSMAHAIAIEGRIRHAAAVQEGHSNMHEGLNFWAPNINIFRDPRWGRGQETFGEDPYLTGRVAVAYIKGIQGNDTEHPLAIATAKHFAVHSGPEASRHVENVAVSRHDEADTYLPAFRAAVTEGNVGSVMCAYNSINGQPACANQILLVDTLRGKWGFSGYVVSDCAAIFDIFANHHYGASRAEGTALSVRSGMDNECSDYATVTSDHDYRAYIDAVRLGLLQENELDRALIRTLTARFRLGLLDPPSSSQFNQSDPSLMGGESNRALARKIGNESMVLLKNDGILPLKRSGTKIAVVGPLADATRVLLGNYSGTPRHTVSILEGMRAEFGADKVTYEPGTTFLDDHSETVPASALPTPIKVTYTYSTEAMGGKAGQRVVAGGTVSTIDPSELKLPPLTVGEKLSSIRWEGQLVAPEAGVYNLGVLSHYAARLTVQGRPIARSPGWEAFPRLGTLSLEAGKPVDYAIDLEMPLDSKPPKASLKWVKPQRQILERALASARAADVVVAVVGITSLLEGEEMEVSEAGFSGGDRTSLDLPRAEQELLSALAQTGKPLVVVLTSGSAISINSESKLSNAVRAAFYPGEEGGSAVAQTLSGRNNPAGRLPVTFYSGVDQLPPFDDYSMKNRTYRFFNGKPLYPFGFGLSYTRFSYGAVTFRKKTLNAGETLVAEVMLKNIGRVEGDEVAQAYLKFPPLDGAPRIALRGFQRVHLGPGTAITLRFELKPRDLSMVTAEGQTQVSDGEYTLSIGGGQPGYTEGVSTSRFRVQGTAVLGE